MSLPKSTRIQREMAHIGGVQMELLGRAGSEAGIQLLAVGGMPNQKIENHVTTSVRFFSYLPRIAVDGQVCIDGGGFEPARPLNFIAPGALMGTKGGGVTGALCVFNEKFMTHLVEIERDFHFAKIGCLTSIDSRRLTHLGQAMLREALSPGFGSALSAEAVAMAIALEITRCDGARCVDELLGGGLAPWQMRRLDDYVRTHLADDLTLPGLAELLGISVRHLSRVVKHTKGMSVHRWVADLRMTEAQRLLSETNLPLHDIARRVAFKGAGAFSTAFRAVSGFSPSDFRRLTRRI